MIEQYIKDKNFLNIYRFGSHVYGTNNENSDEDYICVVGEKFELPDINIHLYNKSEFQHFLDNHDIQLMECYCLPDEYILKEKIKFNFTLNKSKLRHSISMISNGSWVKGKKKLIVPADYDLNLGLKSVFHSLRILEFGIQLAKTGLIRKYDSMNYVLKELWELSSQYDRVELWEQIDKKYKPLWNSMKSEFTTLCPKGYTKNNIKMTQLKELLKNYDIENEELINEIYSIFVKG